MPTVADAVIRYAPRLHAPAGDAHHVASPLGAWLVLALAGSAARGGEAEQLGDVLGLPVGEAADAARALLDDPHPGVAAAAAAWAAPGGADAERWLDGLPAAVARGPVPSRADAWAWWRRRPPRGRGTGCRPSRRGSASPTTSDPRLPARPELACPDQR